MASAEQVVGDTGFVHKHKEEQIVFAEDAIAGTKLKDPNLKHPAVGNHTDACREEVDDTTLTIGDINKVADTLVNNDKELQTQINELKNKPSGDTDTDTDTRTDVTVNKDANGVISIEVTEKKTETNVKTGESTETPIYSKTISDIASTGYVDNAVAAEADARQNADDALSNRITQEKADRENADGALSDRITQEKADRENADGALSDRITQEKADRENADGALSDRITQEKADRESADGALSDRITQEKADRESADGALSDRITQEKADREAADGALSDRITQEKADRESADGVLSDRITQEKADRENADGALSDRITQEKADRENADGVLSDRITQEKADREAADVTLQNNIDAEAQTRADNDIVGGSIDRTTGEITLTKGDQSTISVGEICDSRLETATYDSDKGELTLTVKDHYNNDEENQIIVGDIASKEKLETEVEERKAEDARIEQKFDKEVSRLDSKIDKLDGRIEKVGAMSAAIANLHTMGYDPAAPTEIAVGVGQYRDKTGLAVGAFHYPNRDFMMSFSVSTAGDEFMAGIGATWKIGRKSPEQMLKAQQEKAARERLAEAEAMKKAAKDARVAAQQARHAKMLAERSK